MESERNSQEPVRPLLQAKNHRTAYDRDDDNAWHDAVRPRPSDATRGEHDGCGIGGKHHPADKLRSITLKWRVDTHDGNREERDVSHPPRCNDEHGSIA